MRVDAWVTSAVEEKDVNKALVVAASLRNVYTSKQLVVLTSVGLSEASRNKLATIFDLVIPIQQQISSGWLTLEELAKVEAISLTFFSKCVYLSPNALVLENCDDVFDKYGAFAGLENGHGMLESSSVFMFSPSQESGMDLREIVDSLGVAVGRNVNTRDLETGNFMKCFNLWKQHNFQECEKLDGSYNVILNFAEYHSPRILISNSHNIVSMKIRIAEFGDGSHPLDNTPERLANWKIDCTPIEKFAIELCEHLLGEMEATPSACQLTVFKNEPIAIVGLSLRAPGANNVDEFWELLINGKDAISLVPDSRWTRERTYLPCQNREVHGGFLSTPIDEFDSSFFGISAKEAEIVDPQHRLLHEVAWEALEDAMIDPLSLRGAGTGIFVGSWLQDYRDMLLGGLGEDFLRTYLGNSIGAGAGRLSHFLGTTGPSIATESGCSSAMVAVDMACKSLRNRESNLALACGVNLLLKPFDHSTISMVTSPDGHCKTFDEGADGFGRAEGCAVLLLKRLSDAMREGNYIWGLIRGSAITQEGVSKSLGTPTVHCESLAMELALTDADVDPSDVSYIEAHGTGTPVGDPLEIAAIRKAYSTGRSSPLVIGSVKTNIGHTESVSGIMGIIKVLLSMRNEKIPKHLNLRRLNPAINLDAIPAKIPLETEPWLSL